MVCRFQGQWGLCEFLPLGWPKLYFKATWKKVRLPNSIKSWHSGVQKRQIPFSGTRRRRCTTSEIHEKLKQRLDTVPSGTCVYDHSPSGAYRMQNSWWHTTLNVSFTQYSVRPPHISACQRFWLAAGRRVHYCPLVGHKQIRLLQTMATLSQGSCELWFPCLVYITIGSHSHCKGFSISNLHRRHITVYTIKLKQRVA